MFEKCWKFDLEIVEISLRNATSQKFYHALSDNQLSIAAIFAYFSRTFSTFHNFQMLESF